MAAKPLRKECSGSKPHRILIVEDHPLMREGIAKWINYDSDLEVCGEAETAAEALKMEEKLEPDLVICDISLGRRSGLELLKDFKALKPRLPVVMLSMHDESIYALRSLRAGARGYVMKKAGGADVVAAIKEVLADGTAFSRSVTAQLMSEVSGREGGKEERTELTVLTDREFEVLQLFGEGKTTNEIASHMNISPKTAGAHRLNICRKLGIKSTAGLIRYAVHFTAHAEED